MQKECIPDMEGTMCLGIMSLLNQMYGLLFLKFIFLPRFLGLEIFSLCNINMFSARCRFIPTWLLHPSIGWQLHKWQKFWLILLRWVYVWLFSDLVWMLFSQKKKRTLYECVSNSPFCIYKLASQVGALLWRLI